MQLKAALVAFVACESAAQAFVVVPSANNGIHRSSLVAPKTPLVGNAAPLSPSSSSSSSTACSMMLLPAAVDSIVKAVATVPTLYALMSVNEYVTHRYYQHAEFNKTPWMKAVARAFNKWVLRSDEEPHVRGGGHVEHHAETLDDMTLKTDEKWRNTAAALSLDDDPYRGTAFSWQVTLYMTIQMLPSSLAVFMGLFGYSLPTTLFGILLPGMMIHALAWNALHPNMHALPDIPLAEGAPSSVFAPLRNTPYFRFLYTNHQGHHVLGGRYNYNVCCPGVDHLVGTYCPESEWAPYASSTYLSHHGQDVDFEQQIRNHVAREKFFATTPASN